MTKPRIDEAQRNLLEDIRAKPDEKGIYISLTPNGEYNYRASGNLSFAEKMIMLTYGLQAMYVMLPEEDRQLMNYYEYTRKVAARIGAGVDLNGVTVTTEEMHQLSADFFERVKAQAATHIDNNLTIASEPNHD